MGENRKTIKDLRRKLEENRRMMSDVLRTHEDTLNTKNVELNQTKAMIKELEANIAKRDEDNVCIICFEKPRTHACSPCGHFILCDGNGTGCHNIKGVCPKCRQMCTIIKIYT